ncbi:MAG: lysoplasmalogenase family protein [Gemmiger sp.]
MFFALRIALLYCLPLTAALFARGRAYLAAKALASVSFVTAGAVCAVHGGNQAAFWSLLPAFLCCLAGDLAMAAYNLWRRNVAMLAGMTLFLAGHCCFLRAFALRSPFAVTDLLIPLIQAAALVYGTAVCAMLSKAMGMAAAAPTVANLLLFAGAVLLYGSDVILLFQYFYAPAKRYDLLLHRANLLTYYPGMLLMALSLLW